MIKVFNLTDTPLHFHGQEIQPFGGSTDFPDDTFFPDRDLKLETNGVIAFGALPAWYVQQKQIEVEKAAAAAQAASYAPAAVAEAVVVTPAPAAPVDVPAPVAPVEEKSTSDVQLAWKKKK
jgi:hypothetical protein